MPFKCIVASLLLSAVSYASPNGDGEEIPAGEDKATTEIVASIRSKIKDDFNKTGHAVRDAHRKSHGCVKANFTVMAGLQRDYAKGLFATPRSFPAIVRFSNGSGQSQNDQEGDARGMAIKLLGVEGDKILEDETHAKTQDFVMINHPVFFVRNAKDYIGFQNAVAGGTKSILAWMAWRFYHEGWILNQIRRKTVTNPLSTRYWSMTPSKLEERQMKFSAEPCPGSELFGNSTTENMLKENMTTHLQSRSACFDFKVQLRSSNPTWYYPAPIEDPTVEWSESAYPFKTVARIEIPPQVPVQGEACDGLSFTPWHSLPSMRPLGGIQRVRKQVYQEISKLRHELNGEERVEPAGN